MEGEFPRIVVLAIISVLALSSCGQTSRTNSFANDKPESKLIRCDQRCDLIASRIIASGGRITARYRNIPVIAVQASAKQLAQVSALVGGDAIVKDLTIASPNPTRKMAEESFQFKNTKSSAIKIIGSNNTVMPNAYAGNNKLTGANVLHDRKVTGKDVIVAVIDSGTANNSTTVPMLTDTVIGGENFVDTPDEPSATSTANDDHGTWIGVMIAGHGQTVVPKDSDLALSVGTHSPESVTPFSDTEVAIPVLGAAPDAKIYALKTFPANGDGAPSSRVLAAMDRVLTLKKNFIAGGSTKPVSGDGTEISPFVYDALDIKVLNMSLGGPTMFPGLDIDDQMTEQLLDAGIVVVTAAGNQGFTLLTESSPASGLGSLSVGASTNPVNERIMRDMQKGLGNGIKYRPTDFQQVAIFSSRGPTADGRIGVHVLANGHASFVQGADGNMSMVSGTSLSTPTIAGIAALLWAANPNVTARDIRTAIVAGANPNILKGAPGPVDQGYGFVDTVKSNALLAFAPLPDILPTQVTAKRNSLVKDNIAALGFRPIRLNERSNLFQTLVTLTPGETRQFLIESQQNTDAINVEIVNVIPELPTAEQNELFGDDVVVNIVDAPLSFDERRVRDFTAKPSVYDVTKPQPGLVRVGLMGDWTNKGNVTVRMEIKLIPSGFIFPAVQNSIEDKQSRQYEMNIASTTTRAELKLSWSRNWNYFPAHDIDLVLTDPTGTALFDGATLSSPEVIVLDNPAAGTWTVSVDGFQLHEATDRFQLRAVDQSQRTISLKPLPPAAPAPDPGPTPAPTPPAP